MAVLESSLKLTDSFEAEVHSTPGCVV